MMGYDGFLLGCRHRRETKTKQKPKTTERMSAVVYDDPLEKGPKFHDKNSHYKKNEKITDSQTSGHDPDDQDPNGAVATLK